MECRLGTLIRQELGQKCELTAAAQAMSFSVSGDQESKVWECLLDLQAGPESLNADPQGDEDRHEIFQRKMQIANTLVKKARIHSNLDLHVEISVDLLSLPEGSSGNADELNRGLEWLA